MRLLVTRPSADGASLVEHLAAQGHVAIPSPLLDIENIVGDELKLQGVQALLFTSANGVRAFARRSAERALPALCVGDATGRAAMAAGFADVSSASGDVEALAQLVCARLDPQAGALVHAAGSRIAGELAQTLSAAGFTYRREVLYRARKAEVLPAPARTALAADAVDGVLLYSPRTGAAFATLVGEAGLARHLSRVTAYCLSPAVAEKVQNLPWAALKTAVRPDQDALLALLEEPR